MKLPRLTFLARFTIATFAAAVVAAIALAYTLESLHQRAVVRDEMVTTIGHIDATIGAPLDHIAHTGRVDAADGAALRSAMQTADLYQFVSGLRIYRTDGTPVYPANAPSDTVAIRDAAASDSFVPVERGDITTVYEPYTTGSGKNFVIALDTAPSQIRGQFASERWEVIAATLVVVALIFIALVALAAGASRELERRRRESQATFVQTLTTLAEAIDLRDPYTAGHSRRVAQYSRLLAEDLGLPADEVETIQNGALLHDMGKIGVPDAVLFKAGPLDADERLLIRAHPVVGAGLLRDIPTMCDIVPCVLHHHERFDGSGYPDGLLGEAIPLGARIIAVADAFDAMTTDRPYRRGLGTDAAVAELLRGEGIQFDRRCVLAFAELVVRGAIVPPPRATGDVRFAQRTVIEKLRVI